MKVSDITGNRYGALVAIERAGSTSEGLALWRCRCDCGGEIVARGANLRSGNTTSCGCVRNEQARMRCTKHGDYGKRLHTIWRHMKERCEDANNRYYYCYGGRGVSVCEEWHDYEVFKKWALENGYDDQLSIDRIDNDKDYSPDNCRWATMKEQQNNRSNNCRYTYNGDTHTVAEWADILGVNKHTLYTRLRRGVPFAQAIHKEV